MRPEDDTPEGEEELRQLAGLCRQHAPEPPSEAAWDGMAGRIAAAVPPPARTRWGMLLAFAAAAAVLLVVLARPWTLPPGADAPGSPLDDEPFAVATASEIHVLGVAGGDADALAMGRPLLGGFDVAAPGEVRVEALAANTEGETPRVRLGGGMTIIHAGTADDEEP